MPEIVFESPPMKLSQERFSDLVEKAYGEIEELRGKAGIYQKAFSALVDRFMEVSRDPSLVWQLRNDRQDVYTPVSCGHDFFYLELGTPEFPESFGVRYNYYYSNVEHRHANHYRIEVKLGNNRFSLSESNPGPFGAQIDRDSALAEILFYTIHQTKKFADFTGPLLDQLEGRS